ncbi:HNH endonuclease [Candidatus Enterococcus clewellii]|uniref:Uncharacterized protein n=1 Tax=Candidatus Enterococcus clewellii TaxID=1834193 RepID=A0A242K3X7_9ENTE|nr:HNH endonuclease [Enterococcus sp. 9E7_DIV0242]OTP13698.1 hypothetical protein A5888_003176 [Enterococcus sp. 9E7_DIV0242]
MTIKAQKEISFINECSCIVDETDLAKAILWYQDYPMLSKKKIYMHGCYPAVSIGKTKIHVHRLLMQYWLGIKLPFHASIHHVNENKLDARKENLAVVINSAHNSNHNRGRILSDNHKKKISKANKNRKGIKMKKRHLIPNYQLQDLLNHGLSINTIAKLYQCDWSTIKSRIHENPELLEAEK